MKYIRQIILFIGLAVFFSVIQVEQGQAQCAMCSLNAENSTQNGNEQGKGLNNGILFLLAMPFLIGGGIAILWYKNYRNKEEKTSVFN